MSMYIFFVNFVFIYYFVAKKQRKKNGFFLSFFLVSVNELFVVYLFHCCFVLDHP
jgi:hypothetical protein